MIMTIIVIIIIAMWVGPGPSLTTTHYGGTALERQTRYLGRWRCFPPNRPASIPRNTAITCPSATTWGEKGGGGLEGCMPEIRFPCNSLHRLFMDLLRQSLVGSHLRMKYLRTRNQPGCSVCQAGVTKQAEHLQMAWVGTTALYPGLAGAYLICECRWWKPKSRRKESALVDGLVNARNFCYHIFIFEGRRTIN